MESKAKAGAASAATGTDAAAPLAKVLATVWEWKGQSKTVRGKTKKGSTA
jgi:hypothetical protein